MQEALPDARSVQRSRGPFRAFSARSSWQFLRPYARRGTDLESSDVYGAVAAVNFIDMTSRFALTNDLARFRPVERVGQLADPTWIR
jgi:hypothetical protein